MKRYTIFPYNKPVEPDRESILDLSFGAWLLIMQVGREDTPEQQAAGYRTGEIARIYHGDDDSIEDDYQSMRDYAMTTGHKCALWYLNGLFNAYVEYLCRIMIIQVNHSRVRDGLSIIISELGLTSRESAYDYLANKIRELTKSDIIKGDR